ncbi:hypothetical protein B0J11DRAFT_207400 [Dendryphion nanum]|uniref:Cytochrome b561 domain-containing protein n=1 Tax=Dendryphion nanum TaxID=256645 RepID=A0A9P9D067_9PLEO|nr:hypothetical protein B0J11DRAFT_207400 [Dendryphion nanum]
MVDFSKSDPAVLAALAPEIARINKIRIAHGTIIGIAVVLWFPTGVFLLRLLKVKNTVRWHQMWQALGLFLLLVGLGMGAWLNKLQGGQNDEGHVILGIFIAMLFVVVMPLFGWLHHRHFLAHGNRNWTRSIHVWGGRLTLILGIINIGTGLRLSDNTRAGWIVYGITAGLMAIAYVGVWYWKVRQAKTYASESQPTELGNLERVNK